MSSHLTDTVGLV